MQYLLQTKTPSAMRLNAQNRIKLICLMQRKRYFQCVFQSFNPFSIHLMAHTNNIVLDLMQQTKCSLYCCLLILIGLSICAIIQAFAESISVISAWDAPLVNQQLYTFYYILETWSVRKQKGYDFLIRYVCIMVCANMKCVLNEWTGCFQERE